MRLQNIYKSDIDRDINGVIKVAQDDEKSLEQELREYVITKELRKHFSSFYSNYSESIESPTDKIGVWISGFFGSGKSHFLKMLSYLLSNKVVAGKPSIEYFRDKFDDPMMVAMMEQCAKIPTETILFNIDSKAPKDKTKTVILDIFAKVFYEQKGFYGEDSKVAKLEQFVDQKGKTEEFHKVFEERNGSSWEESRDIFDFLEDDVTYTLVKVLGMSEEAAHNWFNNEASSELSIEQLVKEIKEYIDSKGKDFRLIFLVDEIGQYIGSDSNLMLNLQTIVEEIGIRCEGRVWVIVTSQEAIDSITKIVGNDFSKIQGRFNTRLSLSSSSVDEVIQKRILAKTDAAEAMLYDSFEKNHSTLKNLFVFKDSVLDMKGYSGSVDFVQNYPFIPYQFRLMQNVLAQIRKHGNSGKHLSGGERSMLSGFQEAAQAIEDRDENALVPFYLFYDTVHTFLESAIRRVIDRCQTAADEGDGIEQYDVKVLKLLYLIRYVDDIPSNPDNITVLMADDIQTDKMESKKKIQQSLDRLVSQNYIARNGDKYTFLTDDEQDIAREIRETVVENSAIVDTIGKIIFGDIYQSKKFHYGEVYDFSFDRMTDETLINQTQRNSSICLRFITVASEIYTEDDAPFLMKSRSDNAVIIVLSGEYHYFDELENSMKISKYVSQKSRAQLPESIQRIIRSRQQQASEYEKRAKEYIVKSISEGRVYAFGERLNLKITNVKARIEQALGILIESVYTKLDYIRKHYKDDSELKEILSADNGQMQLAGSEKINSEAAYELEQYMNMQETKHIKNTTMGNIQERFSGIPFGWREIDIAALVAHQIAEKKLAVRYAGGIIPISDSRIIDFLRRKSEIENVIIEKKGGYSQELLKKVREFLREYFNTQDISTDGDDVVQYIIENFTKQKQELSDLLEREYASHNYPDKSLLENGKELCNKLLFCKNDSVLLLQKAEKMSEDFLDFAEDYIRVKGFFKNQRVIFDDAQKTYDKMNKERDYLQNEADAMKYMSRIREILQMKNPYSSISELPDLCADLERIYKKVLDEKREEILNDIRSAMSQIHQAASVKQEDIKKRADNAFVEKRSDAQEEKSITSLDAMKNRISGISQQFMRQIEAAENPEKDIASVSRNNIFNTTRIENQEDIEKYLKQVRKILEEKLSEHDVISII